jgi:hypothetical protein
MIDVTAAGVDVVHHAPALRRERVEDGAHVLLPGRAAIPALDQRDHEPVDRDEREQHREFCRDERPAREACRNPYECADEQARRSTIVAPSARAG